MSEDFTGPDFKAAREALGWSRTHLARRLECDEGTLRHMEESTRPIPPVLRYWLAPIAAAAATPAPPPALWLGTKGRKPE